MPIEKLRSAPLLLCTLLVTPAGSGCQGTAEPAAPTAAAPASASAGGQSAQTGSESTPVSTETATEAPPSITTPGPRLQGCSERDGEGDGVKTVRSESHDWILTVPGDSKVRCKDTVARVQLGPGLSARMVVLPASNAEHNRQLHDFVQALASGFQRELRTPEPPKFDTRQLGDAARLAQCTSTSGQADGSAVQLVACITTVRNQTQETLLHTVTWVLPKGDFELREQDVWDEVARIGSSWFRLSDLDAQGTLRHGW